MMVYGPLKRPHRKLPPEKRRDKIFRFRISKEEYDRLTQLAKDRGVDRAEVIREGLGFSGESSSLSTTAPPSKAPDPKKEPGAAGITELADRIARKRPKGK